MKGGNFFITTFLWLCLVSLCQCSVPAAFSPITGLRAGNAFGKELSLNSKILGAANEDVSVATIKIDGSPESVDEGDESVIDERIEKIKFFWKEKIYGHNHTAILEALDNINQPFFTLQRITNDSSLMYKQMLQQFLNPLTTFKNQIKWFDKGFAVHLKGLAVLSTSKHLIREDSLKLLPQAAHGVHLLGSSKLTRMMKYSMVEALAASIGAKLVIVNQDTIESLRQTALKDPMIVPKEILTDETMMSALIDLADEDDVPYVVAFDDDLTWITENADVAKLIASDMTSEESRVFYLMLDPSEVVNDGRSIRSFINASPNTQSSPDSQEASMPASFMDSMPPAPMLPWDRIPNQPGFPPAVGRSFQVIMHKNGSTSMVALPPSAFPNHMPRPPDSVLQRIIQEQQKKLQRRPGEEHSAENAENDAKYSAPPFPFMSPDMSEEEVQEFLRDPENQPVIKDFMDKLFSMIANTLPPGMDRMPDTMDFKVQMMQIPIPWPQQMNQRINEEREQRARDSNSNGESSSQKKTPKKKAADGENNNTADANPRSKDSTSFSSRFPGFMRNIGKRNMKKSAELSAAASAAVANATASNDIPISNSSTSFKEEEIVDINPLFEDLQVTASLDHSVRAMWDQLIEDELAAKIEGRNLDLFRSLLSSSRIDYEADALTSLHDSLRVVALSKQEAKAIIVNAVKIEASKLNLHADSYPSSSSSASSAVQQPIRLSGTSLVAAAENLLRLPSSMDRKMQSTGANAGASYSLTKQELNQMITDKHERGLLPNVMFPQDIGVSYEMIGGLAPVKELLRQCITYPLKYPRLYREGIASEAVKGVLLYGPPGTGKTMLAKAVATEGGAAFLSIDASAIENKWLGESEKNARAVFTLARRIAPCVVFIDEVDSLLSSREYGDESTHGTITSVKTTLMQEWDGLRTTKDR
jgi:hypothetical protein